MKLEIGKLYQLAPDFLHARHVMLHNTQPQQSGCLNIVMVPVGTIVQLVKLPRKNSFELYVVVLHETNTWWCDSFYLLPIDVNLDPFVENEAP